ncbi:MAG: 4-hydroxyphenylpyruvate dioxygenase [Bdellovibrionales bacterium]|nr:4-hydroxyphenylpyruvate dioxygenase [Bdellovibrionales bacterium]
MSNSMGITSYDYVEFYVGSAKMAAYWYAKGLGMDIKAYKGPETGCRDRTSYYLTKNDFKIVVTSPLQPDTYDIQTFLQKHGDGVKRWAYQVKNVEHAFTSAVQKGAVPVVKPFLLKDDNGVVHMATIKIYDDTEIVYFNNEQYKGLFQPGFDEPVQKIQLYNEDSKLLYIDHVVGNVRVNEMDQWANYFNQTMDFETFVDFGPGDISTKYSALLSKVVRSKDSVIKNPINEPYKGLKKSQIEEYIEHYHGSGVQHVAIATDDIVSSIQALRKNGIEFLEAPETYYENMRKSGRSPDETIEAIERQGILCDFEDITGGEGYLLQLFTKPIGDRPTFFFEIIQRVGGAQGFGQGNFQALFESIEQDQAKRGNL